MKKTVGLTHSGIVLSAAASTSKLCSEVPAKPVPCPKPEAPVWSGYRKTQNNDSCPCGSGEKYKRCCKQKKTRSVYDSEIQAQRDSPKTDMRFCRDCSRLKVHDLQPWVYENEFIATCTECGKKTVLTKT